MRLVTEKQKGPFKALLEAYHQCFYDRNLDALRALYVADENVIYFDNHADCDSRLLADHLEKVKTFFETGSIVRLDYEDITVYEYKESAFLVTTVRYSNRPRPGVRASFFLEKQQNDWKIRHIHYSSDPNEDNPDSQEDAQEKIQETAKD